MSILRKPKADITINIPEDPLHPGSTINTVVRVSAKESFSIRSGSVELTCTEVYWQIVHTGKSTRQQKRKHKLFKIKERFTGNINFTMGTSIKKSVNLILPDGLPPTVIGKTVNISWQLKASLDIVKMRDITEKLELTVLPIATAIPVFEGSFPGPYNKTSASSEEGKLTLSLESELANGGEYLHGSFETKVEKDINAREIRMELEVKESAGSKSSKMIADSIKLEEQVQLTGGYYRKWRFELKIPDSPPPTTSTNKSSVIWTVKGIIDKSWKRDFSVNYPIQVY